jgi:hypothetical protein
MNADNLKALTKGSIPNVATNPSARDITFLIDCLTEKDDKLRYNGVLLLQANSRQFPRVYQQWDALTEKLENSNAYQRSIGVMLIAENVRWDTEGKFTKTIDRYLSCCMDEKFITARQAVQELTSIITATSSYNDKIKETLAHYPLDKYKANQQKILQKDIANTLKIIEGKTTKP